jgi:hypothetical protein
MNCRNREGRSRVGSTLIIVAGLASLLLLVSVTFLQRIRADGEESALVVRDAQARIMLVAALQYLQETSRLGWRKNTGTETAPVYVSDAEGGGDGGPGYECYGWTDVRDGSIGPRGPRVSRTVNPLQPLPVPTWWTGVGYPGDELPTGDGDPQNAYAFAVGSLPPVGTRQWPCPGSAMRGDMFTYATTRYAVRLLKNPTPYKEIGPTWNPDPTNIINHTFTALDPFTPANRATIRTQWDAQQSGPWGGAPAAGFQLQDPQPVADTLGTFVAPPGTVSFRSGDLTPRAASTDLSWFRAYRELPEDHDNDGVPWFDRVPLQGHGTFLIACGAGGTAGYRFWDLTDPAGVLTPAQVRDLEPVTAEESGRFADKAMFDDMRANERILWYRAEWTANQGGQANVIDHYGSPSNSSYWTVIFHQNGGRVSGDDEQSALNQNTISPANPVISFFGAFKWIQRLEKDPITW